MDSFFVLFSISVGDKKRAVFDKERVDLGSVFFKEFGDVVKGRARERITAENVKNVVSFGKFELEISSIAVKVENFETILDIGKERFSIEGFEETLEVESRRVGDDVEDLGGFREVLILKDFDKFGDLLEVGVVNKW